MNKFYFLSILCLLNISLKAVERDASGKDVLEKDLSCEVCPSCESARSKQSEQSDCFEEISNDENILGEIEKGKILNNQSLKDEEPLPFAPQIEEIPKKEVYEKVTAQKDNGGIFSLSQAQEQLRLIDKNPYVLEDPDWMQILWNSYKIAGGEEGFNLREPHLIKEILELLKRNKDSIAPWSIENWNDVFLAGFIKASSLTEKNTIRSRCVAEDTLDFLGLTDCFWNIEHWHIPLLKTFETLTKNPGKISLHALIISEGILDLVTKRIKFFMGLKELEWDACLIQVYGHCTKSVMDSHESQINNKPIYRLNSAPVAKLVLSFWQKNPTCESVAQVLQKSWRKIENKEILQMILNIAAEKKINLPDKVWN